MSFVWKTQKNVQYSTEKKKKICWPTELYVHLFYLFILLLRKYDGFDRRHFANTGRSFDKNTRNSAFTLIKP